MIEKELGITREDKHILDLIYALDVYKLDLKRKDYDEGLTYNEKYELSLIHSLRKQLEGKIK